MYWWVARVHAVLRQTFSKHQMCARARGYPASGLASHQRARMKCMLGRSSACGSTPQPGLRPCQKTSYAICRRGGLPQRQSNTVRQQWEGTLVCLCNNPTLHGPC